MAHNLRFKATIAGKEYTIVGQKSPQHLNTVVDIVNNQLEQLMELAPELSTADRSILMSVNAISDQLIKEQHILELEKEIQTLKTQIDSKQSSRPNYSRRDQSSSQNELFGNKKNNSQQVPFERE